MKIKLNRIIALNKRFKLLLSSLCLVVLGAMSTSIFASSATMVVDAPLKESAGYKAKDLAKLNKGDSVEILSRNRGWYKIKSPSNLLGWISLLQVRFDRSKVKSKSAGLGDLIGLRKGHNNVTATTGVRGINENDIKNAKPNFAALYQSRQFMSTEEDAKNFAKKVKLKSKEINYEVKRND